MFLFVTNFILLLIYLHYSSLFLSQLCSLLTSLVWSLQFPIFNILFFPILKFSYLILFIYPHLPKSFSAYSFSSSFPNFHITIFLFTLSCLSLFDPLPLPRRFSHLNTHYLCFIFLHSIPRFLFVLPTVDLRRPDRH